MPKDTPNPAQGKPGDKKDPDLKVPDPKIPNSKIQGEGDYEAARRYRSDVEKFVADEGQVGIRKKAVDAEKAIDGGEGEDLRRAEAKGQAPARR